MTFSQWQEFSRKVSGVADRIREMKMDRLRKEGLAAGVGDTPLTWHNASIDRNLVGWCAGNPAALRAARRIDREEKDWTASRIAERIISRAYARVR